MWVCQLPYKSPQAGFDSPKQREVLYQTTALPPSHHGWILTLNKVNTCAPSPTWGNMMELLTMVLMTNTLLK